MASVNLQKGSLLTGASFAMRLDPGFKNISKLAAAHYNPKSYLTPPKETVLYYCLYRKHMRRHKICSMEFWTGCWPEH